MNQGQVVSINDVLAMLLRTCEQYLETDKGVEAKATYDNVVALAMVYGSSDEIVRAIFRTAFKFPGQHPELQFFGRRATVKELAQLHRIQQGSIEATRAIEKASESARGFPPLFG